MPNICDFSKVVVRVDEQHSVFLMLLDNNGNLVRCGVWKAGELCCVADAVSMYFCALVSAENGAKVVQRFGEALVVSDYQYIQQDIQQSRKLVKIGNGLFRVCQAYVADSTKNKPFMKVFDIVHSDDAATIQWLGTQLDIKHSDNLYTLSVNGEDMNTFIVREEAAWGNAMTWIAQNVRSLTYTSNVGVSDVFKG